VFVQVTLEYSWDVPTALSDIWGMNINNFPSGALVHPIISASGNDYGFTMDAVFRSKVYFPRTVLLCQSISCTTTSLYHSAVVATYSDVQRLGFSIGELGKWSKLPSKVDVMYSWVGVYPSMTLDPIVYMDGLGQVFNGTLDVKVRHESLHRDVFHVCGDRNLLIPVGFLCPSSKLRTSSLPRSVA
jgi:hypothetical protein